MINKKPVCCFFKHKNYRRCVKKCGRFLLRFTLVFIALTVLLRFIPIPFSAYMAQQKIGHLLQFDFDYELQYNWVNLNDISPEMQLAVIAAEDQLFAEHYGFDWNAIGKALSHNQKSGRIRGASTISQQTAKNLYLWHGKSYLRKGLEIPITILLENVWSKRRILEVYLNIAEFGEGIFGVEAASRHYFNKPAKNLTAAEAALLAAVLPNPIIYRADKPGRYVRMKQAWVLRQMNALGKDYLKRL